MYRSIAFASVLLAGMAMATAARADSTSELLEKGIYTEETAGDLDKAITIYEKVVAEAKASHLLAARAQYRIGQCLLKKDKKAEATAAFEKLISDFPEAKELVAKARHCVPAGLPLGPVPWVDGEVLQLRFRMATGMDVGTRVYTIQSARLDGRKIWRVNSRTLVSLNQTGGRSQVDAGWEDFRPLQGEFMHSLLGSCTAKYSPNHVSVTVEGLDGKSTKKELDLPHLVYDNEQVVDVIRRLPLAPGYTTTLPVLGLLGVNEISIPLEVVRKETIKVPAGQFECFNVHLGLVNQTFWYSTDPHRYLVKINAEGIDVELMSIGQNKPGEPRRYTDDKLGVSLSMPNDWFFYDAPSPFGKKLDAALTFILDPMAISNSCLFVHKLENAKIEKGDILRTWADAAIAEASKSEKDFKVRADSWQQRTISGLPSLSVVADYTDGTRKMVDYYTVVAAKTAGLKLTFRTTVPQAKFNEVRKAFDAIIESLKVKQP